MNNKFKIDINERIEIKSFYNYDYDIDVIVYNNENFEIYKTSFRFKENIVYWISLNSYKNIKIKFFDKDTIIYEYDLTNDFVYVTCGDIGYLDLIEKLVVSLNNVSNRKIIVYGINCDVPFDYPNLIKRRYNTDIKSEYDKWFWKQRVCLESYKEEYNNYVWMDGDTIANINIDNISEYFNKIENYPLCDIHIHDEQLITQNGIVIQKMCQNISEYYGIKRKVLKKDLHACFYVYNKDCKWFFNEMIERYEYIRDNNLYDPLLIWWNDECLMNFMMSKYNFTKTLPLSNLSLLCEHNKYNSNPEVLDKFYKYWIEPSPNNFNNPFGWSYVPENKEQVLYFHENKNLNDADEMIKYIYNIKDKNKKECFLIGAYCNTKDKINVLKKTLNHLKKYDLPIIISSHYKLPVDIIESIDGFIYDPSNEILYQKDFNKLNSGFWYHYEDDTIKINKAFDFHHDYAFWTQLRNGFGLAKNKGFDIVYFLDFDVDLDDDTFIEMKNGIVGYDFCSYPLYDFSYLLVFACKTEVGYNVTCSFSTFKDYFYNKPGQTNCEKVFYNELLRINSSINLIQNKLTDKTNFQNFTSFLNYYNNNYFIDSHKLVAGIMPLCNSDVNDNNLYLWCNILENNDNLKIYVEYNGEFIKIVNTLTKLSELKSNTEINLYANCKMFYTRTIEDSLQFKNMNYFRYK